MSHVSHRIPDSRGKTATDDVAQHTDRRPGGRWLAVSRIGLGFVFLWAFVDKLFGLGYATPAERSWLNGGSPTAGFLGHAETGPFRQVFQAMAGSAIIDWLFMLGLLGIGIALILGIGLRVSAVAGTVMMVLMYAAEWPLARVTAAGDPTSSTNPLIDYHLLYAAFLIVLALTAAGTTWGLGKMWQSTRLVQRAPWLA